MSNLERCILDLNQRYDKGSLFPSEYRSALERLKAMQPSENEHEMAMRAAEYAHREEMARIEASKPPPLPKKTMADVVDKLLGWLLYDGGGDYEAREEAENDNGKFVDLQGDRYGQMVVLEHTENDEEGHNNG